MGGFHRACMGKNKRVIENFPRLHFSLKGPKSENLKKIISLIRNGQF